MRYFIVRYPGDPPLPVTEMSRAEFLERFPREPVTITRVINEHTYIERYHSDAIVCDFCNDDPGDTVYVYASFYGICAACFKRRISPYCTEVTDGRS
jgi:hypothetical protein